MEATEKMLNHTLLKRLATAIILIPLALALLFYGSSSLKKGFVLLLYLGLAYEWAAMSRVPNAFWGSLPFIVFGWLVTMYPLTTNDNLSVVLLGGLPILFVILFVLFYIRKDWVFVLGQIYMFVSMLALLSLSSGDPLLLIWLLSIIWINDSAAYFGGKLLKGPKLWERVSPNKTWSGLITGVLVTTLFGGIFCKYFFSLDIRFSFPFAGLAGLIALIGNGGDLLESAAKRHYGVKDSGNILPGHGGLLDRLDSFLAVLFSAGIILICNRLLA